MSKSTVSQRMIARRPEILVFYGKDQSPEAAEEVCYGAEEEGIPCVLEECGGDPSLKALEYARGSQLETAVSLTKDHVRVYSGQLKKEEPLLEYPLGEGSLEEILRFAGKNSARLVRHRPLIQPGHAAPGRQEGL